MHVSGLWMEEGPMLMVSKVVLEWKKGKGGKNCELNEPKKKEAAWRIVAITREGGKN